MGPIGSSLIAAILKVKNNFLQYGIAVGIYLICADCLPTVAGRGGTVIGGQYGVTEEIGPISQLRVRIVSTAKSWQLSL